MKNKFKIRFKIYSKNYLNTLFLEIKLKQKYK